MPKKEQGRPDLNRPFDPETTADGVGYAWMRRDDRRGDVMMFYKGEWKDRKPHGRGRSFDTDGFRYEGEWRDGTEHGHGTMAHLVGGQERTSTFHTGIHEGTFGQVKSAERLSHGDILVEFTDGRQFKGMIMCDGSIGGTVKFPDDDHHYEGVLTDGQFHAHEPQAQTPM